MFGAPWCSKNPVRKSVWMWQGLFGFLTWFKVPVSFITKEETGDAEESWHEETGQEDYVHPGERGLG